MASARAVASLPPKRHISPAKPLHLFRTGVASLRRDAISTFNFNDLRDPPVFSPVVPVNPKEQLTLYDYMKETRTRKTEIPHKASRATVLAVPL